MKVHFSSQERASVTDVPLWGFEVTMMVRSPNSDTDVRMATVVGNGRLFSNKVSKVTTLILTSVSAGGFREVESTQHAYVQKSTVL